jgi:hypothetical protein
VASLFGLDVRSNVNQVVQRRLISTKLFEFMKGNHCPICGSRGNPIASVKAIELLWLVSNLNTLRLLGEETPYVGDRNRNVQ